MMTPASYPDSPPVDRETAELRLANRLSVEAVQVALAQSDDAQSVGGAQQMITFRVMYLLARSDFARLQQAASVSRHIGHGVDCEAATAGGRSIT